MIRPMTGIKFKQCVNGLTTASGSSGYQLLLMCYGLLSRDPWFACLFAWGLTALSAQIGYIAP